MLPLDASFAPVIETQAQVQGVGAVPLYGVDLPAQTNKPDAGDRLARAGETDLRARRRAASDLLPNDTAGRFTIAADRRVARMRSSSRSTSPRRRQALNEYGTARPHRRVRLRRAKTSRKVEKRSPRDRCRRATGSSKPGARSEENQRMLRAFRWNLRVLSYISLVVGAFLIYNTISVSVVRRRAGDRNPARARRRPRSGVLGSSWARRCCSGWLARRSASCWGALLAAATVGLIARP